MLHTPILVPNGNGFVALSGGAAVLISRDRSAQTLRIPAGAQAVVTSHGCPDGDGGVYIADQSNSRVVRLANLAENAPNSCTAFDVRFDEGGPAAVACRGDELFIVVNGQMFDEYLHVLELRRGGDRLLVVREPKGHSEAHPMLGDTVPLIDEGELVLWDGILRRIARIEIDGRVAELRHMADDEFIATDERQRLHVVKQHASSCELRRLSERVDAIPWRVAPPLDRKVMSWAILSDGRVAAYVDSRDVWVTDERNQWSEVKLDWVQVLIEMAAWQVLDEMG